MAVGGSIIYEIEADTSKFNDSMKSLGQSFTQVGEAGETAGSSFGAKFMAAMQKYDIAGKLKGLFTDALGAGGALEQSMGGIQTLFKENADVMIENANRAYETAGMSANQYMETVTSFSASLLQGLGGDTVEAAKIADRAVQDMSDNANKFGTDISMIQSAYQGFAKQNYTMLDNLKLGYGGTKTEMERLIKDAATMTESMDALGITIDANSMSFDNIANAISVVQHNMGVMGTTSKEASETLQGSANAMKGAFENLMASLALGEEGAQKVGEALEAAISSTGTYLKNVVRMAANIAKQLPEVLFNILDTLAWDLLPQGAHLIEQLGKGITEAIPTMLHDALSNILYLSASLRENFGSFVDAGLDLIMKIAQGIADGLPELITYVPLIISNIAGLINDNMPKILETGRNVIVTLGQGLIEALPVIWENMGNIMQAVVDVIKAIQWLDLGKNIIQWISDGAKALFNMIPDLLKNIGDAAVNFVKSIDWPGLGSGIINFISNGIKALITAIPNLLKSIGKNAVDFVKSIDWLGLGKAIIDGIVNGIRNFGAAIANTLMDMAKSAWGSVKSFLGISSPSKLMRDTIGKNISLGVAEGIDEEADSVNIAATDMFKGIDPEITLGNINQNITSHISNSDIISLLENYLPEIAAQKEVRLDTGTLVGEMSDGINRRLGLTYYGQI